MPFESNSVHTYDLAKDAFSYKPMGLPALLLSLSFLLIRQVLFIQLLREPSSQLSAWKDD